MAKIKKKLAEKVLKKKTETTTKVNPFEVHINKQKYQVLGQKGKNDRGLPGVSRAKAIKKRKHTLLPEYNVQNKTNKFVDRRIGERNFAMSEEERQMARYTAERIKHHSKKSIFNLADDEVLTHRGQTLSEIEKFDDPRSEDEEDEEEMKSGKLGDKFVGDAHFGGGVLTKTGKEGAKSHKDLIEQLIAESKKRKAEKQKLKEQTLELTEKLDSEWKDLLPLVSKIKKRPDDAPEVHQKPDDYDKTMRQLIFEARGHPTDRLKSEDELAQEEKNKLEQLEQDRLNRMKGFVGKPNQAKHRSADDLDDDFAYDTEPEVALAYDDEGKLLNKFESNKGDTVNDEEDQDDDVEDEENDDGDEDETDSDDLSDLKAEESDSEVEQEVKKDGKGDRKRKLQGESSKDVNSKVPKFDVENKLEEAKKKEKNTIELKETKEDVTKLKQKKQVVNGEGQKVAREEAKQNEISKENKSLQNDGPSLKKQKEIKKSNSNANDVKEITDLSRKEINKNVQNNLIQTNARKEVKEIKNQNNESSVMKQKETKKSDPTVNDVKNLNDSFRKEIMEKAEKELPYTYVLPNRYEALQSLLTNQPPEYQNVIIERMIKCNHPSLAAENKDNLGRLFVYLLQYLNDVSPEKGDSSNSYALCFSVLNHITPHLYTLTQMNPINSCNSIVEVLKEKQSEFKRKSKVYPGVDVLVFLKLISCLFSTSDFRHQVVTSALVFIGQMLTKCKVKSRYDIAYGVFLVTLYLEYTSLSKRFMPAAIIYLSGILHMAVPKTGVKLIRISPPFKSISTELVLEEKNNDNTIELNMNFEDFTQDEIDENFKLRTTYTVLKLTKELSDNLKHLPSYVEIFEYLFKLLEMIPTDNYPNLIRTEINTMKNSFTEAKKTRKIEYVVQEKKRPKALRLYEPSIEKVFDGRKHKPISKERADREKLIYKHKKEMKGALREIRRDKSFLGRIKINQRIQSDMERKEKVRRIFADASIQQGELNSLDRKKNKK